MDNLTKEDLEFIGDQLGYVPKVAKSKARRFISYLKKDVKNWNYDETIHWGDMHKIIPVIELLRKKKII